MATRYRSDRPRRSVKALNRNLTSDERDRLRRRQGEVCRQLEALHSDEVCPGDEAPLIPENGFNRELDEIEDALAEDCR